MILARDYEEAVELYRQFGNNMLGVISDVSFMRGGRKDPEAGLRLARYIREQDPYVPIIIESSEVANAARVGDFGGVFLDKNSKKLPVVLGEAITENFGFGDFVMRDPAYRELNFCAYDRSRRCSTGFSIFRQRRCITTPRATTYRDGCIPGPCSR